ncbi:MAG: ABC transporter substrate-binding protein [Gammaproteobacteria bacterium]|nr:ABC transporter substrate-binding protein [Gammaproteobacteria bacterium]
MMSNRQYQIGTALALIALLLLSFNLVADQTQDTGPAESPSEVITRLNTALLNAMKNAQSLGYQGRYKLLDSAIRGTHDLKRIARYSVGKFWYEMTEEQRKIFTDKFARYSIATYVNRFNGYGGEDYKTVKEQSLPRGRVLVKALLESPEYGVVNFDYILDQDAEKRWRIINIMADGVSDLALKRVHYTDVIKKKGLDALFAELDAKTQGYIEKQ